MTDGLLTISAFARRVGLTPSALRFYDDCGLLRPAEVDHGNGYRYYAPGQQARAELLRDLREIDLPLADVRVVLDGGPAEAAAVVSAHLRTVEGKADAARRAAARILGALPPTGYESRVTLGGPELASAVRQVAPAAARTEDIPALGCVQFELGEDEVTLVATDRYQLSVRKLQPHAFSGARGSLLVRAPELSGLTRWVAAGTEVVLETGPAGAILVRDGETRELAAVTAEFPAYQAILAGLTPPACRAVVDRLKLIDLLSDGTVALDIEPDSFTVTAADRVDRLDAIGSGVPVRLGFDAALLAGALAASVGPDVLLEIVAEDRPVVVRSADQGTFTTLVMPTRLER